MTANAVRKDAWNRNTMDLSGEIKFPYQRKSTTHFHLLIEYLIEQIKRHANIKLEIS